MSAPQFLRVLLRRQQNVNMAGYLRKLSSVPQKAHGMTKSQMQKAAERGGSWEAAFSSPRLCGEDFCRWQSCTSCSGLAVQMNLQGYSRKNAP